MNDETKVKNAINAFFKGAGLNLTFNGNVNSKVAEVFGEMISETQKCSAALSWVPRPSGGKATITWIARNFGRSVLQQLSEKDYLICAREVVRKYKTRLTLAGQGV